MPPAGKKKREHWAKNHYKRHRTMRTHTLDHPRAPFQTLRTGAQKTSEKILVLDPQGSSSIEAPKAIMSRFLLGQKVVGHQKNYNKREKKLRSFGAARAFFAPKPQESLPSAFCRRPSEIFCLDTTTLSVHVCIFFRCLNQAFDLRLKIGT